MQKIPLTLRKILQYKLFTIIIIITDLRKGYSVTLYVFFMALKFV